MLGRVGIKMVQMAGILKDRCIAKVSQWRVAFLITIACGIDLMTQYALNIKKWCVQKLLNLKQRLVPKILQEASTLVEVTLAPHSLGRGGLKLVLIVLLYLHHVLKQLSLGLWRVLVVMKDTLLKRG